jgi:hypothetical protein
LLFLPLLAQLFRSFARLLRVLFLRLSFLTLILPLVLLLLLLLSLILLASVLFLFLRPGVLPMFFLGKNKSRYPEKKK